MQGIVENKSFTGNVRIFEAMCIAVKTDNRGI